MNVSKSTLRVPLIWSGKTKALKHMHRALCQIKTLAVLEFEQDLLAARPVKWCFKGKHIVTVTPDSQICVPSEEKVKHIIHLKMHQICSPALSWHPAKSRHHCASVFSLSVPLVTFTERNKASCQHLLCERALSVQPKSWKLQTSTPQCGQFWQSHVPIRTVTECNSWPNNGTKRKQKKMDAQRGQPQLHGEAGRLLPTSLLFKSERCPQCLWGFSAMEGGELAASATPG